MAVSPKEDPPIALPEHALPSPEPRPPEAARKPRLEKGEWTLIVCGLVILGAIPAYYLGLPWLRSACVYIGSAALIGAFTNRIAIHALFDPWPSRSLSLPYTGIIEMERKRIEQAIMSAVAERLITPEILKEELRDSDYLPRFRDEVAKLVRDLAEGRSTLLNNGIGGERLVGAALAYTREAVDRALLNDRLLETLGMRMQALTDEILERPESYEIVRERFKKVAGPLGRVGHLTGVTDYDEMTYRILDGIREEIDAVLGDPDRLRDLLTPWLTTVEDNLGRDPELAREFKGFYTGEFRKGLGRLAERVEQWDVRNSPAVDNFIDYVIKRVDVRQVVGRALNKLSTQEVKLLILKHSREHLGWLEVWGGVLGAVGGAFLWALSPWL